VLFDAEQLTRGELRSYGRSRRKVVPRNDHGDWKRPDRRSHPLDILRAQDETRVPELVPIRYGRMLQSPFTLFRGSAAVMAADLASTPTSGINVQACGDAHVGNFGVYASPERRIVFDINDFDETLPGPWEWDLKRLAVSLLLDTRDAGWSDDVGLDAVRECVVRYQEVLDELAELPTITIEYEQLDEPRFLDLYGTEQTRKLLAKVLAKASRRTHEQAIRKWVRYEDGAPRFVDDPPLIEHLPAEQAEEFHSLVNQYRATLQSNRRHVLEQYRFRDVARKVVGVGSVGLRAYIVLMQGRGPDDLLVLQAKEAVSSVLSPYWGRSGFRRRPATRSSDGPRWPTATSTSASSAITRGPRNECRRPARTTSMPRWWAAPSPGPTPDRSTRPSCAATRDAASASPTPSPDSPTLTPPRSKPTSNRSLGMSSGADFLSSAASDNRWRKPVEAGQSPSSDRSSRAAPNEVR